MTVASIRPSAHADVRYVLRLADSCLIHAQRLTEWCGHAPALEEDIALSNIALDLLGQSRALLTRAGQIDAPHVSEDELAFLRDEQDFFNLTLVELPLRRGGSDFADTVLRTYLLAAWLLLQWRRLATSRDGELVGIAAQAVKEASYHRQHSADWVVRLGDGSAESARRMAAAVARAWPYTAEMFAADDVDREAAQSGLGPSCAELQAEWDADVNAVLAEACLSRPVTGSFRSEGRQGRHSEHLGFLLAEMQHLQRSFPGGVW